MTLPPAFEIDQRHLGNICTEKELVATQCAGKQAIGTASTDDAAARPAAGGPGLRGLRLGRAAAARLRPRRPGQPDAPRRKRDRQGRPEDDRPGRARRADRHFVFNLFGGKKGYLENTRDICVKPVKVKVAYTAQSGKTLTKSIKVSTPCPKKKAKPKRG